MASISVLNGKLFFVTNSNYVNLLGRPKLLHPLFVFLQIFFGDGLVTLLQGFKEILDKEY